ncbi:DUF1932 domain-containing protein [Saccharopolyspora sp. K220]|uniref:NAD(P)-dependent oxidoreductase n=1 Tax=Saccharopolyspora soli TaxID=2926618 RepID=UPI001F5673E3|nr:NAD(P)-dependent oxidoreductase [Saccharopolyspora soli]MCI2418280.1 DUF1932 domain-containing protein [Saccharopolyspora soli]
MRTVGLLHPGRMGAAVGAEIRRNGHDVLWCTEGRSEATRMRAEQAGLTPVDELRELLERCDVVLSICPPAAAEELARRVAGLGFGGVFADANAVNPATLHRIVAHLDPMPVVDGSIIGPPPSGHRTGTRLHLSGPAAHRDVVAELVSGTRVEPVLLGTEHGQASALKMAFASYQKAARVLAAVAHSLADAHGVSEALLAEADRMPGRILAQRDYLPSVAARAWRWGLEMREIAQTLSDAGLPPELAEAAATVLARWDVHRGDYDVSTDTVLKDLRR